MTAMVNVFVIHTAHTALTGQGTQTSVRGDAEGPFGDGDIGFGAGEGGADLIFVPEEVVGCGIVGFWGRLVVRSGEEASPCG